MIIVLLSWDYVSRTKCLFKFLNENVCLHSILHAVAFDSAPLNSKEKPQQRENGKIISSLHEYRRLQEHEETHCH